MHQSRRRFITLLGGAASWPLAARAQPPLMPLVGFLGISLPDTEGLRAFHLGLKEAGYVDGDNVTILHRWTEGRLDQLPEVAADLVRRRVAVIASFGNAPALAAKAATTTIPIVFGVSQDPVSIGLVDSLARPGGNVTGFNYLSAELTAKRMELLLELMPGAKNLAVLVDPAVPPTQTTLREVTAAASTMGLRTKTLNASDSSEINAAFATLARERADVLFVGPSFLFIDRRVQLVHLATLHKLPTTYSQRRFPEIGGLMSYGANYVDVYRQIGVYTGRILKGVKPADLPVVQSTTTHPNFMGISWGQSKPPQLPQHPGMSVHAVAWGHCGPTCRGGATGDYQGWGLLP
jgi:putative ABC transport system substrate-binding protein